jgi:hypothetical protein
MHGERKKNFASVKRMKCEHKEFIYIEEDFEEGIIYCECLDCGKQFKKTILCR